MVIQAFTSVHLCSLIHILKFIVDKNYKIEYISCLNTIDFYDEIISIHSVLMKTVISYRLNIPRLIEPASLTMTRLKES